MTTGRTSSCEARPAGPDSAGCVGMGSGRARTRVERLRELISVMAALSPDELQAHSSGVRCCPVRTTAALWRSPRRVVAGLHVWCAPGDGSSRSSSRLLAWCSSGKFGRTGPATAGTEKAPRSAAASAYQPGWYSIAWLAHLTTADGGIDVPRPAVRHGTRQDGEPRHSREIAPLRLVGRHSGRWRRPAGRSPRGDRDTHSAAQDGR
jgi:hypothetical protein